MLQMFKGFLERRRALKVQKEAVLAAALEDMEILPLLLPNEIVLSREEMLKRAQKLGANLGEEHAYYLLAHQEKLPHEWRRYRLTLDPVGETTYDDTYVGRLHFLDEWEYGGLGVGTHRWDHCDYLLRSRKSH